MADLTFITSPTVTIGNTVLTHVPIILQVEDTPLIEVVRHALFGHTTRFSVFDSGGNDIARVVGKTVHPTTQGKEVDVAITKQADAWVCKHGQDTIFEIEQSDNNIKVRIHLYTPAGTLVKISDGAPQFFDGDKQNIPIDGNATGTIRNAGIGLHLYADGKLILGQATEK